MDKSSKKVKGRSSAKKARPSVKKKAASKKTQPVKKTQTPVRKTAVASKASPVKKARPAAKKPAMPVMAAPAPEAQEMPAIAGYEKPVVMPAEKKSRVLPGIIIILLVFAAILVYWFYQGPGKLGTSKSPDSMSKVITPAPETTTPAGTPARPAVSTNEDDSCIYVVQPKDSLISIAEQKLGDSARWQEIYKANTEQIKDPDVIFTGQRFKVGCKK